MKYEIIFKYIDIDEREKNNIALSENNSNKELKIDVVIIQIILAMNTYLACRK